MGVRIKIRETKDLTKNGAKTAGAGTEISGTNDLEGRDNILFFLGKLGKLATEG